MHVLGELLALALTSFALASIGIFLGSEHIRQDGGNVSDERREALAGTSFIRDNSTYEAYDDSEEQEDPDAIVDLQYSPGAEGTLDQDKLLQAGYTNVYTVFKAYMQAQRGGLQQAQQWEPQAHAPGGLQHTGHAVGPMSGDGAAALAVTAVAAAMALRSRRGGVQPPAQAAYPLVGGVEGLRATDLLPEFTGELLGSSAACSEHGGTCGSGAPSEGGSSSGGSSGASLSSVPSCSSAPASRTGSCTALGACAPATPTCTPACRRQTSPAAAAAAEDLLLPSCGRLQPPECCAAAEEQAAGGGRCLGGHAITPESVPTADVCDGALG